MGTPAGSELRRMTSAAFTGGSNFACVGTGNMAGDPRGASDVDGDCLADDGEGGDDSNDTQDSDNDEEHINENEVAENINGVSADAQRLLWLDCLVPPILFDFAIRHIAQR